MQTKIKKSVTNWFSFAAKEWAKRYIKKDRKYSFKGLQLEIHKDVFHPGLFRSTKVMIEWLNQQNIANKTVLELGCGSGLISLVAAKNGAIITAVDINPKAVENTALNAKLNGISVSCYRSNLFSSIPSQERFEYVLINPPYFPGEPMSDYGHAWYCGKHFDYFHNLFNDIQLRPGGENYDMILSDNCDLQAIHDIAYEHSSTLQSIYERSSWGETFYIFQVERKTIIS